MTSLSGTIIPMPTPFDENGEVDEKAFREVIDFELQAKVDGLMVAGSYGQGPVMKMYPRWPAKQLDEQGRAELRSKLAEAGWPTS